MQSACSQFHSMTTVEQKFIHLTPGGPAPWFQAASTSNPSHPFEYTLIASLIAVAAITAMRTVGSKVSNVLGNVVNAMT